MGGEFSHPVAYVRVMGGFVGFTVVVSFILWWFTFLAAIGIIGNTGVAEPNAISAFTIGIGAFAFILWIAAMAAGRAKRKDIGIKYTWHPIWFFWIFLLYTILGIFGFILEAKFDTTAFPSGIFVDDDANPTDDPFIPNPYNANQMKRFLEWKAFLIILVIVTTITFYSLFDIWQVYRQALLITYEGKSAVALGAANRSKSNKRSSNHSLF